MVKKAHSKNRREKEKEVDTRSIRERVQQYCWNCHKDWYLNSLPPDNKTPKLPDRCPFCHKHNSVEWVGSFPQIFKEINDKMIKLGRAFDILEFDQKMISRKVFGY